MRFAKRIGVWGISGLAAIMMAGGCAMDQRPHDVPNAAVDKAAGNQRLVYTASEPGTVWVSEGSNHIVYSSPLVAGDQIVVDPDLGKVLLNSQVVEDKDIYHVNHRVFFLAGAAPSRPEPVVASENVTNRPDGVPLNAIVGGEGKDRVNFTVPREGFVWITDDFHHQVLYAGPVAHGDVIAIDPSKNEMTINGMPVSKKDVTRDNHRIFFSTERPAARSIGESSLTPETEARPAEIPVDALKKAEGSDRIEFVAPSDGTIWVVDSSTRRTVYSGRVLLNDRLSLDPANNRLTLNGEAVRGATDLPHDRYTIYFSGR